MIRYVTRWALSTGIRSVEGRYTDDGKYFSGVHGIFVSAREAFATLSEAKADAKQRARKKAALLTQQAARLSDPAWEPKIKP